MLSDGELIAEHPEWEDRLNKATQEADDKPVITVGIDSAGDYIAVNGIRYRLGEAAVNTLVRKYGWSEADAVKAVIKQLDKR